MARLRRRTNRIVRRYMQRNHMMRGPFVAMRMRQWLRWKGREARAQVTGVERIAAAAIQHADGTVFSVFPPGRHHNVIRLMYSQNRYEDGREEGHEQGFVTSSGRFVDRFEGKHIARAAGQLLDRASPSAMLFSEDVW